MLMLLHFGRTQILVKNQLPLSPVDFNWDIGFYVPKTPFQVLTLVVFEIVLRQTPEITLLCYFCFDVGCPSPCTDRSVKLCARWTAQWLYW